VPFSFFDVARNSKEEGRPAGWAPFFFDDEGWFEFKKRMAEI
jgi:hypothetical protein